MGRRRTRLGVALGGTAPTAEAVWEEKGEDVEGAGLGWSVMPASESEKAVRTSRPVRSWRSGATISNVCRRSGRAAFVAVVARLRRRQGGLSSGRTALSIQVGANSAANYFPLLLRDGGPDHARAGVRQDPSPAQLGRSGRAPPRQPPQRRRGYVENSSCAAHRAATLKKSLADDEETLPPAAYLVALLSTLSQLTTTPGASKNGEKRELLEATLYLLSLLTPHLDAALLRSKIQLLATLNPLFPSFATHAPATKSLVVVSQYLLASLSSSQLDKDKEARQVFAHVLSLTNDARPKVRRRAQEAITALLSAPPPPSITHPYGVSTSEWILARLEEAVKGAKRGGKKEVVAAKDKKGKSVSVVEETSGSDEGRAIALLVFVKNLGSAWNEQVGLVPSRELY